MSPVLERWSGSFSLELGRALYIGPGLHADVHAHHALQICIGLEAPLRVRASSRDRWMACDGCVLAPEQEHEFDAEGRAVALFYVEPEGPDGRRVADAARQRGIAMLDADVVARVRAFLADGPDFKLDAAFTAVGFGASTHPTDPRIRRAVQKLRSCRFDYPTSAALAAELGLSTGRFRHLWLAEVGLAYRRYLLWRRLQAAIAATTGGHSLTEAAHAAGFSDSAHLARTFRRLLGIAPSAMPAVLTMSAR